MSYSTNLSIMQLLFVWISADMDPDILNNLGDLQPHSLLYAKIIFALLLSVSLYFLLLSGILFSAIHKVMSKLLPVLNFLNMIDYTNCFRYFLFISETLYALPRMECMLERNIGCLHYTGSCGFDLWAVWIECWWNHFDLRLWLLQIYNCFYCVWISTEVSDYCSTGTSNGPT